jgi:hypothetical protein
MSHVHYAMVRNVYIVLYISCEKEGHPEEWGPTSGTKDFQKWRKSDTISM